MFFKFSKVPLLASLTRSAACSADAKATAIAGFHMQLCVCTRMCICIRDTRATIIEWSSSDQQDAVPSSEGFIRQGTTCRDEKSIDLYVCVRARVCVHVFVCARVCELLTDWTVGISASHCHIMYCRETLGQEQGFNHKKVQNLNVSHRCSLLKMRRSSLILSTSSSG